MIIAGYLALLLGRSIVANTSSTPIILAALFGVTDNDKIESILDSLRELEGVHLIAQRKLGNVGSEESVTDKDVLKKAIDDLLDFAAGRT